MKNSVRSLFLCVLALAFANVAFSATYTVTKTADTNDGTCDADCSLREAIAAANATPDNDVITFTSLFYGTPQLIALSNPSTDFIITNNGRLDIIGPGPRKLQINGGAVSRVITANTGSTVFISGIRVSGGTGVSTVTTGRGGGVYNNGATLTLIGMEISGNQSTNGGGLSTAGNGTTNVYNTTFFSNIATTGSGGAFQNFLGATTNVFNCSLYSNQSNSTTVGGAAMQANGTVTITNSTIANNNANGGSGGAIVFNGTLLTITNSTVVGNSAALNSGGIYRNASTPLNIRNSIIAGNTGVPASPDVSGIVTSQGNNIIGSVGTSTGWVAADQQNVDPLLSRLGFYGGTGLSMVPLAGSTAINGGDNCVINLSCGAVNPPSAITIDQRGTVRPASATVDIGAVEIDANFRAALPNVLANQSFTTTLIGNNTGFNANFSGVLPTGVTFTNASNVISIGGQTAQTGVFSPSMQLVSQTVGTQTAVVDYSLSVLTSETGVTAGGRVLYGGPSSRGVLGAIVTLTDAHGISRSTRASSLGYYSFDNLSDGGVYTITVSSKSAVFAPRVVVVTGNTLNVDLTQVVS